MPYGVLHKHFFQTIGNVTAKKRRATSKTGSLLMYWIDDQPDKRRGLVDRLVTLVERKGRYKVEMLEYHDSEAFCRSLLEGSIEKPDLIICDLIMPGLNGVQLLRRIREDQKFDNCLVVSSSVLDEPLDDLYARYVGFDLSFSSLPADSEVYANSLVSLLKNRKEIRQSRYSRNKFGELVEELYQSRMKARVLEDTYVKRLIDPRVFQSLREGKGEIIRWRRIDSSVGFVDIRGFTSLASRLQPEDLAFILNAYVEEASNAILRGGGIVDKFIGDAVMWTVGTLSTTVDHQETNIRIAYAIRDSIVGMRPKIVSKIGAQIKVEVGIGLAGGPMDVGLLGQNGPRMQFTVIGPYVNLAARLCQEARPGQILVSGHIPEQLMQNKKLVLFDKMNLKGFQDPILAYEVK